MAGRASRGREAFAFLAAESQASRTTLSLGPPEGSFRPGHSRRTRTAGPRRVDPVTAWTIAFCRRDAGATGSIGSVPRFQEGATAAERADFTQTLSAPTGGVAGHAQVPGRRRSPGLACRPERRVRFPP